MRHSEKGNLKIAGVIAGGLVLGVAAAGLATYDASAQSETPSSAAASADASRCAALVGTKVESGVVESTEFVGRGAEVSTLISVAAAKPLLAGLKVPASFCRVHARLNPMLGSEIHVEIWLPEQWNGKFLGTGGGGFSGGIDAAPLTLRDPLATGYAAAATDVGHKSSDGAQWAYGQPVKLVDWAHRGNHLTAVFAKALIATYYGKPATRAYFQGCSNGGRDALMEASRYPEDYDGIIAGAPATNWTGMMTGFVWNHQAVSGAPGAPNLNSKLKLVQEAVLAKCDALDGVKDGVIENPQMCRFDPAKIQCKSGDGPDCLSAAEVTALRKIYQGPRTRNGRQIYSGFAAGAENVEWQNWITGTKAAQAGFGTEFYRWMVYSDSKWTPEHFDPDRDYPVAKKQMGPIIDSNNPDLRPFTRHGGKLIVYHGWADAGIPAGASVDYYNAVRHRLGAAAGQVRLFMVPGMAHCFGGPGPNRFDMLSQLDNWVENGTAPEQVIATKYDNDLAVFAGRPAKQVRTRPLCAWPKVAHYGDTGSTDDAANFSCVAPK
jgi:hypothetical protein